MVASSLPTWACCGFTCGRRKEWLQAVCLPEPVVVLHVVASSLPGPVIFLISVVEERSCCT